MCIRDSPKGACHALSHRSPTARVNELKQGPLRQPREICQLKKYAQEFQKRLRIQTIDNRETLNDIRQWVRELVIARCSHIRKGRNMRRGFHPGCRLNRRRTVSYTHLDVYKRQVFGVINNYEIRN